MASIQDSYRLLWTVCILWILWMTSLATPETSSPGPVLDTTSQGCRIETLHSGSKVDCSNSNLSLVPADLPNDTITLDLSHNQIQELHNQSFTSLSMITALNVGYNLIHNIECGAFSHLSELRVLNLYGNTLQSLPHDVFDMNLCLESLILSSNRFKHVPRDEIHGLTKLRVFALSNNSIHLADFSGFTNLRHISRIDFSQNDISYIHIDDIKPLSNDSLSVLTLRHNRLHELPPHIFSPLKYISSLNLHGNHFYNFTFTPFLAPVYIEKLTAAGSGIHNIISLNMSNISKEKFPIISKIVMTTNHIEVVPSYAFWGLQNTTFLNLVENKIKTLFKDSFYGLDALEELDISQNLITSLPAGLFLGNPKLQKILASKNEINRLDMRFCHKLYLLTELDLSINNLGHFEQYQWTNPALAYFNVSQNQLEFMNARMFEGLTNLKVLDASFNQIASYSPTTFNSMPNIQSLRLFSESKQLLREAFSGMKKLRTLDISYSPILITSTNQFTHTSSLLELRMCENNLQSKNLYDIDHNSSLFDGLVSLTHLNLQGNHLDNMQPGVFSPLQKLLLLDLSKSNIKVLQNGVFQGLVSLTTLYMSDNMITKTTDTILAGLNDLRTLFLQNNKVETIASNLFAETPGIQSLYLSKNHISTIDKNTIFPSNGTLQLDISGNPFSCTCNLLWFVTWLRTSNTTLLHPNATSCSPSSFKEMINQPLSMFKPEDFCGVNISLVTAVSLSVVMIAFLVLLAYNKRWWINYKFFLLKLAILGYQEMNEDFDADNYEFHLNLMFHEDDEEWVNRVMRPALEERLPRIQNVIFGDEDLHLGMFYINAIYDAIDNSFKTVLLISNRCVEDAWFMTKLRLALEHVNDTGLDKVLLIFLEDIVDENLPYLVRLFLSRNRPYMLWTEDEEAQDFFWAQFEKSMRTNRAINNVIPI